MDQLIFASLSHTYYWYEMGMLKVPAVDIIRNLFYYVLKRPTKNVLFCFRLVALHGD